MDPNETLRQLRVWAKYTDSEAADLFAALDEWLSKGGYFPRAWSWEATNEHIHDVEPSTKETER